MDFYKVPNLPQIPSEFLQDQYLQLIENDRNNVDRYDYGTEHFVNGVKINPLRQTNHMIVHPEFDAWCKANIPVQGVLKVITFIPLAETDNRFPVHTDVSRSVVLNYIVDPGGDNVNTTFYQEQGFPIIRGKKIAFEQADSGTVKYDDLTILDTAVFKQNTWALIKSNVLHDISGMTRPRRLVSIGFTDPSIFNQFN
jgi:hypothetical protein